MAFIDFGAVVFKNGEHINPGKLFMDMGESVGWKSPGLDDAYFAYVGDPHITAVFYKSLCCVELDGELYRYINGTRDSKDWWGKDRRSLWYYINETWLGWDAMIHIKQIGENVYHFSMSRCGDVYHVIYGYGIDPSKKTWDAVKVQYLGKRMAKKIDRLYKRLGGLKDDV